jgi:transposase
MQVVHPIYGGMDGHQAPLTACLRRVTEDGQLTQEVRECATPDPALLTWLDWLSAQYCPLVAMERTSAYGRPVSHALAGAVEVLVGHAHERRRRTDRKPDKADAGWIAALLAHGLIRPSVVPPRHPRAARPDAHPRGPCPDPESGQASRHYTAGGHEHQAFQCRSRPVRGQWPAHARRLDG